MNLVVIGASGFLGMNFVKACQAHELHPTCTYRGRVPRLGLRRTGVETVPGDLDDLESLKEALRGADVVVHFGAHYPDLSVDREATMSLGLGQLDNVLEACAHAGVERLVFASTIATVAKNPEGPSTEAHTFEEAPGFGVYHDLKWSMEQRVAAEDRFETVTLCPGGCLGPFDMRIGTSAMLVALARGERVAHPDGWINLVDARDVAEVARRVVTMAEPPRRLLISGGNYRLHPLFERLAERYGVPAPPPALSAEEAVRLADAAEARAAAEGGRAEVSRELVDMTIHGVEIDASLAERITDFTYRPLEETLEGFEEWARKKRIMPRLATSGMESDA